MSDPLPSFLWRRRRLARDPHTSSATLTRLAETAAFTQPFDPRTLTAALAHPAFPPTALALLAHHSNVEVRQRVASHRHAPVPVLASLLHDDAASVADAARTNPAVKALRLDDRETARYRSSVRNARHLDVDLALRALVHDAGTAVSGRLAEMYGPVYDSDVLEVLAHSHDRDVRRAVAGRRNTSSATLAFLVHTSRDDSLLYDIAGHPNVDEATSRRLLRSYASRLASNPDAPAAVLADLAGHEYPQWRAQVAHNPGTPPGVLRSLADDPDREVLNAVAMNPHTPPDALAALSWHRRDPTVAGYQPNIVETVATNPATPAVVLDRLAHNGYEVEVAGNVSAPATLLAALADLLLDPAGPEAEEPKRDLTFDEAYEAEEAQRSRADRRHRLRHALVGNPATPGSALRRLSAVCVDEVRYGDPDDLFTRFAENPNLPSDVVRDLLDRTANVAYPPAEFHRTRERLARRLDRESDSDA